MLEASLVIHASVDPSILRAHEKRPIDVESDEEAEAEEEAEEESDAQGQGQEQTAAAAAVSVPPNTRRAEQRDGLLSEDELRAMAMIARSVCPPCTRTVCIYFMG